MLETIFNKIFGTPSERTLKRYKPTLDKINALEPEIKALADADFPARTLALKAKVAEMFALIPIPENDEDKREERKKAEIDALDLVLPEAFALCREAARRAIGLRHFDVQLIGGMVLHNGAHRRDAHRRGQDPRRHAARRTSTRWPARASTSSRSTTTWPSATPSGWAASIKFLGLTVGVRAARHARRRARRPPTAATSPTARTTSSASTTCATT